MQLVLLKGKVGHRYICMGDQMIGKDKGTGRTHEWMKMKAGKGEMQQ